METTPKPASELHAELGAHFRACRKRSKKTLKELSTHLGCAVNTVRWMEAGARMLRYDDVVKAAIFMGMPASELIPERLRSIVTGEQSGE
jgi:transcriptional regulator with XRE-family HTH domain